MPLDRLTAEPTELLRTMIQNPCVNDDTVGSGQGIRNVTALEDYFAGSGLACRRFEAAPGRASLVARIEGRDPSAPTLLLMGHTDVVPANPAGWRRDPFGGDVEYPLMFHGNDERVDVESLRLSAKMWEALCREFLG